MATLVKVGNSEGITGQCDARCHKAKKVDCQCVCGGRYHGALNDSPEELARRVEQHQSILQDETTVEAVGPGGWLSIGLPTGGRYEQTSDDEV